MRLLYPYCFDDEADVLSCLDYVANDYEAAAAPIQELKQRLGEKLGLSAAADRFVGAVNRIAANTIHPAEKANRPVKSTGKEQ